MATVSAETTLDPVDGQMLNGLDYECRITSIRPYDHCFVFLIAPMMHKYLIRKHVFPVRSGSIFILKKSLILLLSRQQTVVWR